MDVASSTTFSNLTSVLPLPQRSSLKVVFSSSNSSAPTKALQSQFYGLRLSQSSSLPIPAHSSPPKTQILATLRRGKVAPNLVMENVETAGATGVGINDDSGRSRKILQKSVLKKRIKYTLANGRGNRVEREWGWGVVEGGVSGKFSETQSFVLYKNGVMKHVYKNHLQLENSNDKLFTPGNHPSMFFPMLPTIPKKPDKDGSSPPPGDGSSSPPDDGSSPPGDGGSPSKPTNPFMPGKNPFMPWKGPAKLPNPFMPGKDSKPGTFPFMPGKLPNPFKPGNSSKPLDDALTKSIGTTMIPISSLPKDVENPLNTKKVDDVNDENPLMPSSETDEGSNEA
ncbi:PREDICTED: uncharacterized protein LOC104810985 isoform X1 [Tarenaya hassleriana]|uniref:uncharacterized protein LOC104810985 isoform X2 n=1 Tax=Tarenaya hassleriana TaxID=28532 RepID=UPI00053C839B|nr:PREDICTED: uncharacterized protein LOC104810985 isoform X2 [Tarenaya hassleriana]XP_019057849.1 PREDICTED: uncharacterized protein LOC104810985 isoform X1 [Tarenaya hassleriana]